MAKIGKNQYGAKVPKDAGAFFVPAYKPQEDSPQETEREARTRELRQTWSSFVGAWIKAFKPFFHVREAYRKELAKRLNESNK